MRQRATTHWPWMMTVRVSTTYWDVRTQKQPTTMLRRPLTMAAVNWWPRTTVIRCDGNGLVGSGDLLEFLAATATLRNRS